MKIHLLMLAILITNPLLAQDQWKNVYQESAWKVRDAWQRPSDLIAQLKLKPGSHVADIGCNEGYMTIKLSAVVGSKGKVLAVDVSQSKLDALDTHLRSRNISNVDVIKGDYDDPKLPANKLDAVIILDTYHEMDDHDAILAKVKVALKPNGRLLICEPIAESRRTSGRADQEAKHEVGMDFVMDDLKRAGYRIVMQKDPYVDRVRIKGDSMWIIVATSK